MGLELFVAHGPTGVASLGGAPIFLDLKLHDIPATVAGATRAAGRLGPAMLTVHAAGGASMVGAAREALEAVRGVAGRTRLLAVTVLTSLDAASLRATGVAEEPLAQSLRLARLAVASGADGLVCSAAEVALLRDTFGPDVCLVVPGVRPAGAPAGDQARVSTPAAAVAAGADWIVVGRPLTRSHDPAAVARAIATELAAGLA